VELDLDLECIQKKSRKEKKESIEKRKVTISLEKEINTLEDLLDFIEKNPVEEEVEYNIQLQSLHDIRDSLEELKKIIGMQHLKTNIVSQILYFVQEFYKNPFTNEKEKEKEKEKETNTSSTRINTSSTRINTSKNQDFLHTVISGPPGTGKTEIAKLMGKIYSKLGILSKGTFKKVTRSDLIAGYLGQTAIKTREVVQESLGGVLFIDEAYSLGNTEKRDSFSKECIDTLCEALSDHKDNWMVIIAGYEEELNDCFFNYNQGLDSRFTWRFHTDEYGAEELYLIFLKKVKDIGWSIFSFSKEGEESQEKKIDVKWFEKNKDHFKFYGRDMETLLSRIKIAHSKRVFGLSEREKRKISYEDLEKGLELFLKNTNQKKREAEIERKRIWESIYV
jgi:SpoVK/Ycf46/Vps4 family AAA+-type ATPase